MKRNLKQEIEEILKEYTSPNNYDFDATTVILDVISKTLDDVIGEDEDVHKDKWNYLDYHKGVFERNHFRKEQRSKAKKWGL
ncbi:hypothetical protein LCGC14_0615370 [marine sediment metagenome]|uniref:Uncharacterized protein n=1 Tax=marine sediment metagenome TaxID=412755 RepID=A0A0F9RQP4_9ZZZZ|nr:hypothetical protein [bacterium]